MGEAGAKRGFAERRVLTQWRALMGEEIAEACAPVRMRWAGRDGAGGATLTVEAAPGRAPEVLCEASRIVEKVNALCGWRAVAKLKVTQAGGAAAVAPTAAPPRLAPDLDTPPSPDISAIVDEGLRGALARLEANIAARKTYARPPDDGPDRRRR